MTNVKDMHRLYKHVCANHQMAVQSRAAKEGLVNEAGVLASEWSAQRDGTIKYSNDDVYIGSWSVGGFRDGKGVMEYVDGDTYEGEWKNDNREGHCVFTSKYDTIYEGDWLRGEEHGYGKMTYPSGSTYKGYWVKGIQKGRGTMTEADGIRFEGTWGDYGREGIFTKTMPDGTQTQVFFDHDKEVPDRIVNGVGKFTYENGNIYEGSWVNAKRTGRGKMTYKDGSTYEGGWNNDVKEGPGTETRVNGVRFVGIWDCGMREGPFTKIAPNGIKKQIHFTDDVEDLDRTQTPCKLSRISDINFRRPYWQFTISNIADPVPPIRKTLENTLGAYWGTGNLDCSGTRSGRLSSKWIVEFTKPPRLRQSRVLVDERREIRKSQIAMIKSNGKEVCRDKIAQRFMDDKSEEGPDADSRGGALNLCTIKDENGILEGFIAFGGNDPVYTVEILCTGSKSFKGTGPFLLAIFSKFALVNTTAGTGSVTLQIHNPLDDVVDFYKKIGFKEWNAKDKVLEMVVSTGGGGGGGIPFTQPPRPTKRLRSAAEKQLRVLLT